MRNRPLIYAHEFSEKYGEVVLTSYYTQCSAALLLLSEVDVVCTLQLHDC